MKKVVLAFILTCMLAACSGGYSESGQESTSEDHALENTQSKVYEEVNQNAYPEKEQQAQLEDQSNRMVVYDAYLTVKSIQVDELMQQIENKVIKEGGYVVESSIYKVDEKRKNASLVLRVPSEHFNSFLGFIEEASEELVDKRLQGKDVTDEYVDLNSKLKAARIYEERLLSFMKDAERTEDLLKISKDLAQVQGEIETVEGRIKYLRNRVAFATATITIQDSSVVVPELSRGKDLNTFERTKQAFMQSFNGLVAFFSTLIVIVVGYLPVWILLAITLLLIWILIKKRKQQKQ